jgi:cation diffusion facilitator family transporter
MLSLASRPPSEEYAYGYSKAEYFASGFEGCLILAAALLIAWTALERLIHPQAIERIGLGLAGSVVASIVNFAVARVLLRAGAQHDSIALEADAHHLMTDVWTSAGVVVGVGVVGVTGWQWADALIALGVACNIVWTGASLVRRSASGLMDGPVSPDNRARIEGVLDRHRAQGIEFHALRVRAAAGRSFVTVHVLVPGDWTVKRGHDLLEEIEQEIAKGVPRSVVTTHLEPKEDPSSYTDIPLERQTQPAGPASAFDPPSVRPR